jgi:hypothetical protein
MSKKDEGGGLPQQDAERNPVNENEKLPRDNSVPPGAPAFRAIEEHAAALGISAPVFAAVKQARAWAAGKKVEKAEFEKAVEDFLNAPIGRAAPVEASNSVT